MLNRTHIEESWVAFARIFVGVFWLYEVFVGGRWKLGTPASGYNPDWVGAAAGGEVAHEAHEGLADGSWIWMEYFLETIVLPYADIWANLVTVSQVLFGVCMILGAFTRLVSIGAIVQLVTIIHIGPAGIGPIVAVGHLFALATDAGQYYGVDGWLTNRRSNGPIGGVFERLATLGTIPTRALPVLAAGSVIAGMHYLLIAAGHPGEVIPGASLEMAVLLGLSALGFGFAYQGLPRISIGAELVRVFVGYRLFHEIFLSADPTLNRLPGWGSPAILAAELETVVEQHFAVVGVFVEAVMLPTVTAWAVAFAIVHTIVAAGVLVGWRTRAISAVGLGYLGVLIGLGFTRYAPFVFGLLATVWALGGHHYSLDAAVDRSRATPEFGKWLMPVFVAVAGLAGGAALTAGIAPGGYVDTMGGVSAGMIAIFGVLFLATVLFQHYLESTQIQPVDDARGTVVDVMDAADPDVGADADKDVAADGGIDEDDRLDD